MASKTRAGKKNGKVPTNFGQVADEFGAAGKRLGEFLENEARGKLAEAKSRLAGEAEQIVPVVKAGKKKLVGAGLRGIRKLGSLVKSAEKHLSDAVGEEEGATKEGEQR